MPRELSHRELIHQHLKVLEKKKPGWHKAARVAKLIKESTGGVEVRINTIYSEPTKKIPYFMAYFEGRKLDSSYPGGKKRVRTVYDSLFLRHVKEPEKLEPEKVLEELKKRVNLKDYENLRFYLIGFHPKTGERISYSKEVK